MGIYSNKSSYYSLVRKCLEKSYKSNYQSKFNQSFGLKKKTFEPTRKISIYREEDMDDVLKWKTYLLTKLETNDTTNWKYELFNYIEDKSYFNEYLLKNEMFYYEFSIINEPNSMINLEKDDFKIKTILFPMDSDEMSEYSNSSKKNNNTDENRKKSSGSIHSKISINNDSNIESLNRTIRSITITSEMMEDNPANMNKFNSNQIKRYINFILNQLKDKINIHPIHDIIKYFSELYKVRLTNYLNYLNNGKKEPDSIKRKVINELQEFIEMMQVALKLFYLKSINYKFFISDRDEFINLICYILFNQEENNIYQLVFNLFQKSNEDKQKQLLEKIKSFGEISPIEFGIDPKFCLDEETTKFIENYKSGIKDIKKEIEIKENNSEEKSKIEPNLEIDKIINKKRRKSKIVKKLEIVDEINRKNENQITNQKKIKLDDQDGLEQLNINEQIFKVGNFKKEESAIRKNTITTKSNLFIDESEPNTGFGYKNFCKTFNEHKSKLENILNENMNFYPVSTNVGTKNITNKNKPNKPYQNAVDFINNLSEKKGPIEKLTNIALTSIMITKSIDEFWKNEKALPEKLLDIDADQLMSIYSYIVYNMDLSSIFTQLDFIDNFTTNATKNSMIGYYYITVSICVKMILEAEMKSDL